MLTSALLAALGGLVAGALGAAAAKKPSRSTAVVRVPARSGGTVRETYQPRYVVCGEDGRAVQVGCSDKYLHGSRGEPPLKSQVIDATAGSLLVAGAWLVIGDAIAQAADEARQRDERLPQVPPEWQPVKRVGGRGTARATGRAIVRGPSRSPDRPSGRPDDRHLCSN